MALDATQVIKKVYDSTNNALRVIADGLIWTKYTKTYTNFSDASTSKTITLATMPAGVLVHAVKMKHSAAFTGGGITAYTIQVGITGTNNKYLAAQNVFQAPSEANKWLSSNTTPWMETHLATTNLTATATSTTANLNAATAGSVDIWVLTSKAV